MGDTCHDHDQCAWSPRKDNKLFTDLHDHTSHSLNTELNVPTFCQSVDLEVQKMINMLPSLRGKPSQIGSSIWLFLHEEASKIRNSSQENEIICLIYQICQGFGCSICRGHCQDYLKVNPPENCRGYYYQGRYLGLFLYLWRFHNQVNLRLGKPYYPLSWGFQRYLIS